MDDNPQINIAITTLIRIHHLQQNFKFIIIQGTKHCQITFRNNPLGVGALITWYFFGVSSFFFEIPENSIKTKEFWKIVENSTHMHKNEIVLGSSCLSEKFSGGGGGTF